MALGDYAVGEGPFGFDPVVTSDPRPVGRAPAAQLYDAATRDFPLDSDGNFEAMHPVDQGVVLALATRRGSILSAPDVGHTLHQLDRSRSHDLQYQVELRVEAAMPLAGLLADGSVTTLRIDYDVTYQGRISVAYHYRNNVTGKMPEPIRQDYGD